MNNLDNDVNVSEVLSLIKKNIILFIIIPLLFGIVSYFVTICYMTPRYEASTSVFISSNKVQNTYITQDDVTLSKGLLESYVEVAKSYKVRNLTLTSLKITENDIFSVSVVCVKNTQIMILSVQARTPTIAADYANTLVKYLSKEVIRLSKIDCVEVVDYARSEGVMVYPNTKKNIVISIALGGITVFIIVFLRWFMDKTIRTERDFRRSVTTPFMGSIIKINVNKINNDQIGLLEESYRTIRNNILNSMRKSDIRTILVTSSVDSEGKSITTCNIACAMSEIGFTVLVIDCNMLAPSIHDKFNIENDYGLSDMIENGDDYNKYIKKIDNNIGVLTRGKPVNSSSKIICSKTMIELLKEVQNHYDCILIDAQSLMYSDTVFLAQLTDGLIYVMKSGVSNKEVVYNNIEKLKSLNANIIGGILNYVNPEECSNIPYKSKREQFIDYISNKLIIKQIAKLFFW